MDSEVCKGLPSIKKRVTDFLYEEEGSISRSDILIVGSLVIIIGALIGAEKVFAAHSSHSSHASHASHSSHASHASSSGGYTYSPPTTYDYSQPVTTPDTNYTYTPPTTTPTIAPQTPQTPLPTPTPQ